MFYLQLISFGSFCLHSTAKTTKMSSGRRKWKKATRLLLFPVAKYLYISQWCRCCCFACFRAMRSRRGREIEKKNKSQKRNWDFIPPGYERHKAHANTSHLLDVFLCCGCVCVCVCRQGHYERFSSSTWSNVKKSVDFTSLNGRENANYIEKGQCWKGWTKCVLFSSSILPQSALIHLPFYPVIFFSPLESWCVLLIFLLMICCWHGSWRWKTWRSELGKM